MFRNPPHAVRLLQRLRRGLLLALALCVALQWLTAATLRGQGAAHVHLQPRPAAPGQAAPAADAWLALAWLARAHDHGRTPGQAHHHSSVQGHQHAAGDTHAHATRLSVASSDIASPLPLALANLHATDGLLAPAPAAPASDAPPCRRVCAVERFGTAWVATPRPPPRA